MSQSISAEVVTINGREYVPRESQKAEQVDGLDYVIVRTYSAGVFAGYLKSRNGQEIVLNNARRLWYWDGANSLSQLSEEGVKKPENCKFPCEVPYVLLLQAIEVLPVSKAAQKSIAEVKIWKK